MSSGDSDYWEDVIACGSYFIRKDVLCEMAFDRPVENFSDCKVAIGHYTSPIALLRPMNDPSGGVGTYKYKVEICNSSGFLVNEFPWKSGTVLKIGWSCSEDLIFIQEDGSVILYSVTGDFVKHHAFTAVQSGTDVVRSACIYYNQKGTGVAICTSTGRFFLMNNLEVITPKPLIGTPSFDSAPKCWSVLSSGFSNRTFNDQVRVLIPSGNDMIVVEQTKGESHRTPLQLAQVLTPDWTHMAMSFCQRYVALLSSTGLLYFGEILDRDDVKKLSETTISRTDPPIQMAWCGTVAVMLTWEDNRVLYPILSSDRSSDKTSDYNFSGAPFLLSEVDGLRIVSPTTHELLRPLTLPVEKLFNIGSMAMVTLLHMAYESMVASHNPVNSSTGVLSHDKHHAYELLDVIEKENGMRDAVVSLLEVSKFIVWPPDQKKIIRAAKLGFLFLPAETIPSFHLDRTLQELRLVNNLRLGSTVRIQITHAQMTHLGIGQLIDRLITRLLHPFAFKVCGLLRIPEAQGAGRVLMHWACHRISRHRAESKQEDHAADEKLVTEITTYIGSKAGVNFAELARHALKVNMNSLAKRLLDFETRSLEQVDMLLEMQSYSKALEKSVLSGDANLINKVLFHLQNSSMSSSELLNIVRKQPLALALYSQICKPDFKQTIFAQEDKRAKLALQKLKTACMVDSSSERLATLKDVSSDFKECRQTISAAECEVHCKLMTQQKDMLEKLQLQLTGLTLQGTLFTLIKNGNDKMAAVMRRDFNVSEKRWWHLQISAMAQGERWNDLRLLSAKKCPVGIDVFLEACLANNNRAEAAFYLPKVDRTRKTHCFYKMGMYNEAIDAACSMGREAMEYLRRNLARDDNNPDFHGDKQTIKAALQSLIKRNEVMKS